MSTVDNIRTIPLIVERGYYSLPKEIDDDCESGGNPFERDSDRDNYLRSQLDDIAKRHPELAGHLGTFQQRDGEQQRDSQQPRRQSFADDPDFRRHFPRNLGDRFEHFGFPFDRDSFDPEQYAQQFYQEYPERYYQKHQQPSSQPSSAPPYYQQAQPEYQTSQPAKAQQPQHSQAEEKQNLPSTSEREKLNIQQSNSTDLGQPQEPAVNDRNQRSMSAPPSEKPQRFTSSINIPVNQPLNQSANPTNSENMAQSQSHSEAKSSNERIIPIHIEGRDEPVMPKNAPSSYSQPQNAPHTERLFGKSPEEFTQFLNREPRFGNYWHQGFPEEHARQQRFQPPHNIPHQYQTYQQHASQPKEDIPIPVQREAPVTKQQQQQQPQHQPPPPPQEKAAPPPEQPKPAAAAAPPKGPSTPIEQIQEIQKEVSALMAKVDAFTGKHKNKEYLFLDEMLTRNLIKLDNIDTQGQENIRSARKEAIKCIERTIGLLEAKAAVGADSPKQDELKMEVEEKSPEPPTDTANAQGGKSEETQPMDTEMVAETKEIQSQQQIELLPEGPFDKQKDETKDAAMNEAKEPETSEQKTGVEENPAETCEGQENNLSVSEALKKFEGKNEAPTAEEKLSEANAEVKTECAEPSAEVESKSEAKDEQPDASQANESQTCAAADDNKEKKDEKKDKKKGKKKVEKKEK